MPIDLPIAAALISAMSQPVAIVDCCGKIKVSNAMFQGFLPPDISQANGPTLPSILSAQDFQSVRLFLDSQGASFQTTVDMQSGQYRLRLDRTRDDRGDGVYLCQITPDHGIDSSRLRFLLEHLDQGVWNYNVRTDTFQGTDAWRRMRGIDLGTSTHEPRVTDTKWLEHIHEDDRATLRNMFQGQISGDHQDISVQFRRKHSDGRWIWIMCRASVMSYDHKGRPAQIVGLDTDITNLKHKEGMLAELASKTQLAIDVAEVGVWEFDTATGIVTWDDRLLQMYGLPDGQHDREGHLWESYLHKDDRAATVALANKSLQEKCDFVGDYRIVRPDGEVRHLRSRARYQATDETNGKMFGVNMDITDDVLRAEELEQARLLLEHDAHHDALTGLANRRLLDETMQGLLARVSGKDKFAVLHIDLDFFKDINDTLGHAAGDKVLVHVGRVLTNLVKDAGLVCRNGGDEFVVLLYEVTSRKAVTQLCQGIIDSIGEPLVLGGAATSVGVSIGGAISKGGVEDASAVFVNADVALYSAKSDGRSCYRLYRAGMTTASQRETSARLELLAALERRELTCHYQPQFEAKTHRMIGAEALVRWECPKRGLLLPDAFMPLAQSAGLIPQIDEYVFEHVLAQQTLWAEQGMEVPNVSVNVSRERLEDPDLFDRVSRALRPHHDVSFELLETSFLDDADPVLMGTLDALRGVGIGLALDDFGSGHASVTALQVLKPDRVKIDRSLVTPLTHNPRQILTLQALIQLASIEGVGVIIEGVETPQHLDAMEKLDCDALQGFVLAYPMASEAFEVYLKRVAQVASGVR